MREEIAKKTTKSFEMTAGLQLNYSNPQATMAPELTFNLKKQMTDDSPEIFSLGVNVVVFVYSKDLATYLGINN